MAVEGQGLKKSYADAGVRVDRESPLGAIVLEICKEVDVRGDVPMPLFGRKITPKEEAEKTVEVK
jgi:hypothetical protein